MDFHSRVVQEASAGESASLRSELRLEIAQIEKRMTKWTVICAMCASAVAVVWTMAFTLHGAGAPALGLFVLGTAGQVYAVWRM